MAGWTNKGKYAALEAFCKDTAPVTTQFYVALVTSAVAPTPDINTLGELTEIAVGNGYASGGLAVERSATGWDYSNEDDAGDKGQAQVKDLAWTASGGSIPASGDGARYAILTDDFPTVGSRLVYAYWDLVSDRQVSNGQALTLQNCELDINES